MHSNRRVFVCMLSRACFVENVMLLCRCAQHLPWESARGVPCVPHGIKMWNSTPCYSTRLLQEKMEPSADPAEAKASGSWVLICTCGYPLHYTALAYSYHYCHINYVLRHNNNSSSLYFVCHYYLRFKCQRKSHFIILQMKTCESPNEANYTHIILEVHL